VEYSSIDYLSFDISYKRKPLVIVVKKLIGGLTFRFDSLKNLAGVYNAYCLGQLKGLKIK
jgi:hypothetical protein